VSTNHISPGLPALQLDFNAFKASLGPGISTVDQKKNCQVSVKMIHPGGGELRYQVAVGTITWTGFAKLGNGADLTLEAQIFFTQTLTFIR
jgi:hypothetical protein